MATDRRAKARVMTQDSTLYDFDAEAQPREERTITVCHVDEDYDTYGGRHKDGRCMGTTEPPYRGWLGNPHRLSDNTRDEAIRKFKEDFIEHLHEDREFCNAVLAQKGQRVACHCRETGETEPRCHLDVVRDKFLDGTIFRIAHSTHGISLTDAEREQMADIEEVV